MQRRPVRVAWAAGPCLRALEPAPGRAVPRAKIPADDTVSFAAVTENNARIFGRYAGTPLAWPANWIFARAHDLPAARYDLMVGKRLFDGENTLGGVVRVGDGRSDPAALRRGVVGPGALRRGPLPRGAGSGEGPGAPRRGGRPRPRWCGPSVGAPCRWRSTALEVASFPLDAEPRDLRVRVPRPELAPRPERRVLVGGRGRARPSWSASPSSARATTPTGGRAS